MRPTIRLSTLRRLSRDEEMVLRATMPRTSAADPTPLEPTWYERNKPSRATKTLTFRLGEVAR